MLNEFAVKFLKVSEESLGRDETPGQTCHELCFHKYLSIPIANYLVNTLSFYAERVVINWVIFRT